jgi:tetratricopeptide (TPR) repeat protein
MMCKRSKHCWLVLVLVLVVAPFSLAQAGNMEAPNAAYQRGDWQAAIDGYDALVADGLIHEDLYYNLGNANFRAGRYGHAIYNYERALRVQPGQADAEYNLELAREVVATDRRSVLPGAERDAWWMRLALGFSISGITLTLLLLNVGFFAGLLALRFWVPGLVRTGLSVLVIFLGVATVASGALLAAQVYVYQHVQQGVVTGGAVTMREGPDTSLEERGQLHAGLRLRVLAEEPQWLLVRLANGVEGWVLREEIGLFE